jgi:signal transduction histidine kinase
VLINPLIERVSEKCKASRPVPELVLSTMDFYVAIDGERFEAVLEHIVQNAQDATPDDGVIQVTVGELADQVFIDIVDNGSGMDEKFLQNHLFRPFYTTKGNAGMGIGAYECREFVQNAGGKVQVSSESGVGTKFRILLPISHRNDELNLATHV